MKLSRIFSKITENLPAKILALVCATVLVLLHNMNMLEERQFTVPVEVQVDPGMTLRDTPVVRTRVTIRGYEQDIGTILEEDLRVMANFTNYRTPGRYRAPITYELSQRIQEQSVEFLEVTLDPVEVDLFLDRLVTRSLPVGEPEWQGRPEEGTQLARYYLIPSTVEVMGPASKMEDLAMLELEPVDLEGRVEDFSTRVRIKRPDPAIRFPGGDVVEVQVVLEDAPITKDFRFESPEMLGLQSDLEALTLEQQIIVEVTGLPRIFDRAQEVEDVPYLDLSEITEPGEYNIPVSMNLPNGVELQRIIPSEIRVQVEVRP